MKKEISGINIENWRKEIAEHFPDYVYPAEIALAVLCQLRIKDVFNPFGVIFVGDSSSGKTTVLDFFLSSKDKVYRSDHFTPKAFVSQASNVKKEDLKGVDLIKKIEEKTLIVKEMSPMFGKRDENIEEDFSILTTVFDGMGYTRDAGVHGQRGYEEAILFMFLGATIPFRSKILEIIGKLGARVLFLKVKTFYKRGAEIAKELTTDISYADKLSKCQKATEHILGEVWKKTEGKITWEKKADPPELVEEIGHITHLGAILRAPVDIRQERTEDGHSKAYFSPRKEGPMRLAASLYNFCRSHALICGRASINEEDIPLALRLVLDSADRDRVRILELLVWSKNVTTSEVMEALDCTRPTALHRMREFDSLGMTTLDELNLKNPGRKETRLIFRPQDPWFKGNRFKELLGLTHPQDFELIKKIEGVS